MAKKRIKEIEKTTISERIEYFLDRHPYQLLFATLFLALILRVLALLSLKESIYFDFLLWDERVYNSWAIRIMNGTSESFDVFSGIMALIYKVFSQDIFYVRILNTILGVLTCYLVYLIGREMVNRITGLFACLIASLYKPLIFYSVVPLKTALSVFLFATTIYLLTSILINKNSIIKAFLLGVVIGLLFNVRPNFVFLFPLVPVFFICNSYKEKTSLKILASVLLIYIIGLSLSLAPFVTKRYKTSTYSIASTSQIGLNLYLGNNLKNPDPYYRPASFAISSPIQQGIQFNLEASRRTGTKLSKREASNYWIREVFRMILEQPGAFIWKLLQKSLVLLNQFEAGDHYDVGFLSRFVSFCKYPFLSFWIIMPLGVAGIAVTVPRSRNFLFISSTVFFYGLTLIIFFTNARYRLPIMVVLIPFTVMGVNNLISYVKNRDKKRIAIYVAIIAVFFIIELLPVRGTDDMTAYYNTHAIILNSKGLHNEAIQYWEESSRINKSFSSFANLSLAGMYFSKKNILKANQYLDKIPDDSFAAATKYQLKGDINIAQGRATEAVGAYETSLDINSGNRVARERMIKILWRIDKQRALHEYDILESMGFFEGEMKVVVP
ncbi:tetratricopeptide repeat protein [Deltaproteobacteria bacterium]|nr:tetratricopeptide repeat protein [Deltaproteobacteria bacterium]